MPLRIVGAGFGRTGTWSTYHALNLLGFPCYHMIEVLQNKKNKSHLDFWRKVARAPAGAQHNWEKAFARYTAAVDNPACCVWRELLAAYPDAKVVLTLHPRGPDAWYESTIDTIYFTESSWQFRILEWLTPFGRKFGDMSHQLIWQRSLQGTIADRQKAIARYNAHVEEVKRDVPPEKLLIFSVDQGWEPLCAFLGVATPSQPFPNLNDRAAIKKTIRQMVAGTNLMLAATLAAAAIVAYGAWRLLA